MALLSLFDLRLTFGGQALLDGIGINIEEGDRLCLLGRNGSGKSTLMRVMAGTVKPDSGDVSHKQGLRVTIVDQDIPAGLKGTALDVAAGVGLEGVDAHEPERRLESEQVLSRLGVDAEADFSLLSGGGKRRVLLARALAGQADLLMLDEPTNHLDIDTIMWLEDYVLRKVKSLVFVTHDRAFARRIANRVAELDRGQLYAFSCRYDEFIDRREELLEAELKARALFDKRLAEEEAWVRRGVKARTKRNEGRVKALIQMRKDYADRRERLGNARMKIEGAARSGDLVVETTGLSFAYLQRDAGAEKDPADIVSKFSTLIMRGDKVGIVGPNGAGKTTLIKLLLGQLSPREGQVRLGTGLSIAYFDQMRAALDPEKTLIENLGEGYDTLRINGKEKHISAYMKDFLFSPDRARVPVKILSGGEKNRLLLAKLFAKPSNLLVLDEPTNDLDVETLDLLEDLLLEYQGTILLVSHDRAFLDNVVSDCLVMTGDGQVVEYVGGYGDWREKEAARRSAANGKTAGPGVPGAARPSAGGPAAGNSATGTQPSLQNTSGTAGKKKLSFKEIKELEALPDLIASLEAELAGLHEKLSDPALYKGDPAAAKELGGKVTRTEADIAAAYARWETLES